MVDISDFLPPDPSDDNDDGPDELAALRDCLQALADAVASTNLAAIAGSQGEVHAATQRVTASVAALKRFSEAFAVLKGEEGEDD